MALTAYERINGLRNQIGRLGKDEVNASLKEREADIRDREADVFESARERRLRSQNLTALSDPGRYSQQVYKQAKQWKDEALLRAHEQSMLEKKGDIDIAKEKEHAIGLRGQGAEAAGINADANKSIAETNAKSALDIADVNAKSALDIANVNNASLLERTKAEQASHEKIAGINADAAKYGADASVDVQTEKNKGEAARAIIDQAKVDQAHQNKMSEIAQREMLRQANAAETDMIKRLQKRPEYKDVPPQQLLALIRIGTISAE